VRADIDNVALFVEDAHNVTDKLLLVGGVRFDDIELARSIEDVTSGGVTRYGNTYDPTNWRIGAVYDLKPETQLFAQYSSAVVPVSGFLFISAANSTFELTDGETYEVGVKSSALGDRLAFTASVYSIEQDDILTRDPVNPNITIQGGRQSSTGVEASVTVVLTEQLRLDLGVALLKAEFDELIEAGGANRAGNVPTNTPERLADLTLTWAAPNAPVSVFGALRHNGEFYTTNSNLYRVADVTMLDAGVAWRAEFAEISVRGRNLTDELYAELGFTDNVMIGQPRSVEVALRRSF
jgi:iron complex outermembrane receptor protein